MIRLHHFPKSSASYRVRIALALKGLDYESIPVDLRAAEHATDAYRLLNPDGLVPLLEDGDVRVSQSMAMIEYLEECYPQPALLPSTACSTGGLIDSSCTQRLGTAHQLVK